MWFWDITGWVLGVCTIILVADWGIRKIGRGMVVVIGTPIILIGYGLDRLRYRFQLRRWIVELRKPVVD
jgi:hypothetical protein